MANYFAGNLLNRLPFQRVAHHQRKQQRKVDYRGLQNVASKHLRSRTIDRQLQKRQTRTEIK
ncbi:MAG: hypothetical protein WCC37_04190, partial [Candidatus Sulfotelmatobacter sp.]